jgi:hypothetical protein
MSYPDQDWTEHQLHSTAYPNKNCEWCAERPSNASKTNYVETGEKLRRMANNMEKIGEMVEILDEAKKNNPRGLIF